ncbi:MAG TPA: hypothetical protein VGI75_06340 [Pirellulales bacterium]
MLSRDHAADTAASLINSFACEVEIPARLKENFERTGYMMSDQEKRRRFPRFHCRGEKKRAGLQYQSTLPALPRKMSWHNVYLNNISRGGVSFLHSEPLYPREQMQLLLPNGKLVCIEIVYCRRLEQRCYDIGAHITSGDAEGEATEKTPE